MIAPVHALELVVAAATDESGPNLWGALACAVGYSASLFAILDAFADFVLARGGAAPGTLSPGIGLKFASKIVAAAITVMASGLVLAIDANWFAFTALTIAFVVVLAVGLVVLLVATTRSPGTNPGNPR